MKNIVIELDGLVCPMCSSKIENCLKKQKGIENASISYNNSKAKVSFNEEEIFVEEIKEIIEDLGYDVLNIKE